MPQDPDRHLHYRCAFELAPAAVGGLDWGDLVRTVRTWIAKRTPKGPLNQDFRGKWFYAGGEWRLHGAPRWYVKTARHGGTGTEEPPRYWSLRWEHPCSDVALRQWRTDIGLTTTGPDRFVFSLATTRWLIPGFLGKEPASPVPSAPGIVTRLLGSPHWKAHAGSEELAMSTFLLRDGQAKALLAHLQDSERACPLVLIAKDFATGKALLDPARLAKLLAGAAAVWESETSWVDKELEMLLPPGFRCWNGMVRVYQPRVRLNIADDSKRHRYFTREEIQSLGPAATEEALVRGVVRRARPVAFSEVTTVEDVADKQRGAHLVEMKAAARGSKEWSEYLEKDVGRLEAELKHEREKASRITDLEDQVEDLQEENRRLQFQQSRALTRAQEAESVKSALAARAALIDNLDRLPNSLPDVVDLIQRAYPDRIFFTEKARDSARKARLQDINLAFECLRAMATTLHDLHFGRKLPLREACREFRNSTGFELAVGESEGTRAKKRLAAKRKDFYKGQQIDISPHVKHGNTSGNILRVHYYAHPGDRVLVIGHCGDHLDTVKTN